LIEQRFVSFSHIGVVTIPQCLQLAFQSTGIEPFAMFRAIDIVTGNEFVNPLKADLVQLVGHIPCEGADVGIMKSAVNG